MSVPAPSRDNKTQNKKTSITRSFFHVCLCNVLNVVELHNVLDEVFLWDWLREEEALYHVGSKGEDKVLLFFGLDAFLDGVEGEGTNRFIDA